MKPSERIAGLVPQATEAALELSRVAIRALIVAKGIQAEPAAVDRLIEADPEYAALCDASEMRGAITAIIIVLDEEQARREAWESRIESDVKWIREMLAQAVLAAAEDQKPIQPGPYSG